MGFPTGPAQSYSNPNGIPGLGGFAISSLDATTLPNKPDKALSLEPGEIMDGTRIEEARIVAMEAKMEKLEKDNEALRKLVAHLCQGVASITETMPKVAKPETSDAVLERMASDMCATALDGPDKPMPKNPDTPMSDQVVDDTTGGAEDGPPSTTVQYLTKSQEKVTKEFLAVQKRMTSMEASFENHRKSNAKDSADTHGAHDSQKKTSENIQSEIKDIKRTFGSIVEAHDHARRTDLHQRIKTTMQMRLFKEHYTQLWEKLVQVAASSGSTVLEQVYTAQRVVQVCPPRSRSFTTSLCII